MEQNSPLNTVLNEIRTSEYAAVLKNALANAGASFDYSGFTFPEEQEEGEEPILPGYVEITDMRTRIQIPKNEFINALLAKAVEKAVECSDAQNKAELETAIQEAKVYIRENE